MQSSEHAIIELRRRARYARIVSTAFSFVIISVSMVAIIYAATIVFERWVQTPRQAHETLGYSANGVTKSVSLITPRIALSSKLATDIKAASDAAAAFERNVNAMRYLDETESAAEARRLKLIEAKLALSDQTYYIVRDAIVAACIGFVSLFFVRIVIQFARYYAVLSEVYSSNISAIVVANGDHDLALKYLEALSPLSVKLGAELSTPFEQAVKATAKVGWPWANRASAREKS